MKPSKPWNMCRVRSLQRPHTRSVVAAVVPEQMLKAYCAPVQINAGGGISDFVPCTACGYATCDCNKPTLRKAPQPEPTAEQPSVRSGWWLRPGCQMTYDHASGAHVSGVPPHGNEWHVHTLGSSAVVRGLTAYEAMAYADAQIAREDAAKQDRSEPPAGWRVWEDTVHGEKYAALGFEVWWAWGGFAVGGTFGCDRKRTRAEAVAACWEACGASRVEVAP